ncbi:LTA synthase family protein [Companilactobacillus pabuli]|jgi:lipoteichoic acid synthase|uniref:LTA synthase family protein n=1 Tax=Companilactobacillus pabuli TaxID=2714036 RepID=A0A7L7KV18_9LACO|nr:LTA synthase family protein [Companilactobacillus pabuli]AKP02217.1 alkaline phosphatase [Companilactobacillus farciminis]AKS50514.1 alkaline phosphatase [Companilactobacillus farciminis]MDG5113605.1 LTA synthase family protein [Companilactobacillus pabuli]QMT83671.1 LTA synthase family protein [Companilactobacillus pabuli]
MNKLKNILNKRLGFMALLVALLWIKTIIAYYCDFSLGVSDPLQHFILIINPIATAVILLSIALYINRSKISYIVMGFIYVLESALLYGNILYYREFSDFLSFNTIAGAAKVSKGLGGSAANLVQIHDFIYGLDFIILAILLLTHYIKIDPQPMKKLTAIATTFLGIFLFSLNLTIAESNRPQLLGRTFDRAYIVKYLGLNSFLAYDSIKTVQNNQVRSEAVGTDMDDVLTEVKKNYAKPNPTYFGKAKGKNIIVIHLESFQQFLINYKVNGQEVTPFLNSLYSDKNTMSFDNFYHEVGQGKTSDAENMLETGLFGLPEGSLFSKLGSDNTFQAAPAILGQKEGYTSAVFHGNIGSFWNRDNVYKNMGYDYFFDSNYFNKTADSSLEYGMKDKLMLSESVKYLEQLQQPFYTKFITVTNHYPFELPDEDNDGFQAPNTSNSAVNNYFLTAHYLDNALQEFFNYLKSSGIYDNSMIVLYGDHYGLSNSQNPDLAPLLGVDTNDWSDFNDSQMQKVPFMIHMKGLKGGINHSYGGEIDVLPTILHLAGINTKQYIQLGTDLLSKQHNQIVIFRNKNFVTPHYTVLKNSNGDPEVYKNKTGELVDLSQNPKLKEKVAKWQQYVNDKLKLSDTINNKNLLRFYTPTGFTPVDSKEYNYQNEIQKLVATRNNLGLKSTSVYSQNGNKSTTNLYSTDAPELNGDRSVIDSWSSVLKGKNDSTN